MYLLSYSYGYMVMVNDRKSILIKSKLYGHVRPPRGSHVSGVSLVDSRIASYVLFCGTTLGEVTYHPSDAYQGRG